MTHDEIQHLHQLASLIIYIVLEQRAQRGILLGQPSQQLRSASRLGMTAAKLSRTSWRWRGEVIRVYLSDEGLGPPANTNWR
jgi:hypothetical protein